MKKTSVVIPTYKNERILYKNLKHNLPYLKNCEVIVVNDDPTNSIKKTLDEFLQIILIENEKNLGFSGAVNKGIKKATESFVMLLNDDVRLLNNSFEKTTDNFKDNSDLFAVSFAQKEVDDKVVGKNKIFFNKGFFNHKKADDLDFGINGWAEGGSAIFDREKIISLGFFDEIYSPFYWEDVDLSYLAWKKGYTIVFDPKIMVEHHHETTIKSHFDQNKIKTIAYRNQFIFMWKNLRSFKMISIHLIFLVKQIVQSFLRNDTVFLEGFYLALKKLPHIIDKRSKVPHNVSDYEILQKFTQK